MTTEPSVASVFLRAYEEQDAQRREDWSRLAMAVEDAWIRSGAADFDLPCLVGLAVTDQPLLDAALLRSRARELHLLAQTVQRSQPVLGDLHAMAAGLRAIAELVETPGVLADDADITEPAEPLA